MDPMEEIKQMFFVECEELLEALQDGLEDLHEESGDGETVGTVFRAVHSIKGGAAAFGLDELVGFAHEYETVLDGLRSHTIELSQEVLAILQRSADTLHDIVAAGRQGTSVDEKRIADQIADLTALSGGSAPQKADKSAAESAPEPETIAEQPVEDETPAVTPTVEESETVGGAQYRIKFKPFAALFERGNEPALILRELSELGTANVTCDASALPPLEELDPTEAYLSWTIELTTDHGEAEIREVFEFVEGDCELTIESPSSAAPEPEPAETVAEEPSVPQLEPVPAAEAPAPIPAPAEKPAAANTVTPKPAEAVTVEKQPAKKPGATVRVDLERVDRLINLVGELVINQAMLSQSVMESGLANSSSISVGLEEFKHLTREVQESVLAIRAQPIKPLFQRMSRIVREAADSVQKDVNIALQGEMTEVDKTVIERLSDPLTHMIRNAVDHGLECPDAREAAGKSRVGTVRLTAEHRSGRVLIEVGDDGGGIDRERVFSIAVDKGLIPANAELSDAEIDNLLFLPGFSTAKQVSDLSGRGVGMDVVKRSITSLGGRITIQSEPGQGTTFSISLPLTLAILDGMIVNAAGQTIVVPLSVVLEMIQPEEAQLHRLGRDQTLVLVRGEFVPTIDVGYELGFGEKKDDYTSSVILLIETSNGSQRALVVDAIQDQRQVVIKGLEENYGEVRGIAAATILGDGRIALILDPDAIVAGAGDLRTIETDPVALAG